jgi:hypothetical protein
MVAHAGGLYSETNMAEKDRLIDLWCLTPLSAIFQIYHSDVNYLPQGVEFSVYSGIPPPMKLTATIQLK